MSHLLYTRPSIATNCLQCARRSVSKLRAKRRPTVDIELAKGVESLGSAGQRVSVAPGFMRNHLYPKRMALYVVKGRAIGWDGQPGPLRDTQPQEASTSGQAASQEEARTLQTARIREQLVSVDQLAFAKKVAKDKRIQGSVTTQDVLTELQGKGMDVHGLEGAFREAEGLDKGRIKHLGKYIFDLQLPDGKTPITIQVVQQKE